jgi:hypothetical protein
MNLRCLWGNYADPEFNLTRKQQREVTWLAHRKYLSSRKLAAWTIAMALGGWLVLGFGFKPVASLLAEFGMPYPWLASATAFCLVVSVLAAIAYRSLYRRPMYRAMRDLGYDLCLSCGYRLQGLDGAIVRCPECGEPRTPVKV